MSGESPTRRLLRRAGAVAGLLGLAGCSGLFDAGQSGEGTPSPETGREGSATAATQGTDADCAEAVSERRSELESVRSEVASVEAKRRELHLRRSALAARRGRYPGAFDEETLERARATADRVAESVVAFEVPGSDARWSRGGQGTGWFRRPTEIVTNAHVINGIKRREGVTDDDLVAVARNGDRFDVTVRDSRLTGALDVAVLETDAEGRPLPTGAAGSLSSEQPLVQVGNPSRFGDFTATLGRYAYDREAYAAVDPDGLPEPEAGSFVSGVPSQGGASGSPVVTLAGDVVGVTTRSYPMDDDTDGNRSDGFTVYDRPIGRRTWTGHQSIETVEAWIEDA